MKKLLFIVALLGFVSSIKAVTYTEITCRSGGSNLNAGTLNGAAEASAAASFTYLAGTWTVHSTSATFVTATNPTTDGVLVNQWASVYVVGATSTSFVGRIFAVGTSSVQISISVSKIGTQPTTQSGTVNMRVGGAWAGPQGTDFTMPLNSVSMATYVDVTSNPPRLNLKNNQTYAITAAMTISNNGSGSVVTTVEGYSNTFGDNGMAIIDGGTSGASYVLLTLSGQQQSIRNLWFRNNGASGSANGVNGGGSSHQFFRDVFSGMMGSGMVSPSFMAECEAFGNNLSNTASLGGISWSAGSPTIIRTFSHHNLGTNASGMVGTTFATLLWNVCAFNGLHGFQIVAGGNQSRMELFNNAAYGNIAGSGFKLGSAGGEIMWSENNISCKNGAYGWDISTASNYSGYIFNSAFCTGTEANTSGGMNLTQAGVTVVSTFSFTANLNPWINPTGGDFRLNNDTGSGALARGSGRGGFTLIQSTFTGTKSFPNLGATDQIDSANVIYDSVIYDSVFQ